MSNISTIHFIMLVSELQPDSFGAGDSWGKGIQPLVFRATAYQVLGLLLGASFECIAVWDSVEKSFKEKIVFMQEV